jgi:hypothetical protein
MCCRYLIVIDDIWDISVWKMIKRALPDNNVGNKIIITTRILNVAEQAGGAYKLKPLPLNSSRKLLYRRVFCNENKEHNEDADNCPDEDLAEISDKILKKCAGVPLAIITMASLLACRRRTKMEWYEVYNSVGRGLENNLDVDNMRKILSFSYYDLSSHLRTCLLYLRIFPEDFRIEKDRLIRMWIAEGFIRCEKQGKSLFEHGESYFNELINRSMIQPIYDRYTGTIEYFHVHDMVLDLIHSMASEENFVTITNHMDCTPASNTIRRLSLQSGMGNHAMSQVTRRLQQARSAVVFPSAIDLMPALESFQVLRVLDLEGCLLAQGYSIKYLGNLFHLRYLGLRRTGIAQLPEEIGNLQFLQTLEVRDNGIYSLPLTVVELRRLIYLYIDPYIRVPNGIGKLTCLEELSKLRISDSTMDIAEELGKLKELKVLHIIFREWNSNLLECLCKLQKIQNLYIDLSRGQRNIAGLDTWVAPQHLRTLVTQGSCWFSTLPAWLNPSHLLDLSFLCIAVRELRQGDLEILGMLPALRCLDLEVNNDNFRKHGRLTVGAGSFPCLVDCKFSGFVWPVVFWEGALPRLEELYMDLFLIREGRETIHNDGDFDFGLGNLPLLQHVVVGMVSEGASKEDAEEAKASLRRAAKMHPNHPSLDIQG